MNWRFNNRGPGLRTARARWFHEICPVLAALGIAGLAACGADSAGPPRVTNVVVSPAPVTLAVGATQQLTATPRDASGATVPNTTTIWSTANQSIASVSVTGLVTGVTVGSTTVTATINGVAGTVTVNVTPPPVVSVTIEPANPSTTVGGVVQLTATPRDGAGAPLAGRVVTWSSANQNVATVGVANGLVAGVTAGSTQIIATADGVTGSVTVTVTAAAPVLAITSIAPNPLSAGATATIVGTGFSTAISSNGVTVGGITVPVTAASATSLTVSIPGSICLPSGNATVRVITAGGQAQTDHPFQST
ncbi:MAG: Ig-like domain-containing protein, partial [Longimicrobiales bacterium]